MIPRAGRSSLAALALALAACGGGGGGSGSGQVAAPGPTPSPSPSPTPAPSPTPTPSGPITVNSTAVASFASPWAMVFLPDGRLLVTEKGGTLRWTTTTGTKSDPIGGVPAVAAGGQGGLLDVVLDPQYASNRRIYLSYSEAGTGGSGTAVARGTLNLTASGGSLSDVQVIWRQDPKVSGNGHFGARMAFGPGGHLFITAGDRQLVGPAQDLGQTIGKVIRIQADGGIPADNPFAGQAGAKRDIWSYGHRNPYGLAFDAGGRLWLHEMGPEGGDELNLITAGANYGWPLASNGSNYGGADIPDHRPGDGFAAPAVSWTPVIAPAGMIFYSGTLFAPWQGDALIAGLVSQGLVRIEFNGTTAAEAQRIPLGARIREVEQGPDGAIWVLEDGANGRLLRLTPAS